MLSELRRRAETAGPPAILATGLSVLALVTWLDFQTPPDISLLSLQWAPIAFATWYGGLGVGAWTCAVASSAALALKVYDHPHHPFGMVQATDLFFRCVSYVFFVWVFHRLKQSYQQEMDAQRESQEASRRLRSGALHLMSRGVNNAVTVLQAALVMLKDGRGTPGFEEWSVLQSMVSRLEDESQRFIQVTLLESARLSERLERIDLNEPIGEAARLFLPLLSQFDVQLSVEIPPAGPKVWADRAALSLVLNHLIVSAIKRSKKGGRIAVKVAYSSDRQHGARVSVEGDGPGRSAPGEGSADGLRIVRDLLRLHNSELEGEDSPQGARLSFALVEATDWT